MRKALSLIAAAAIIYLRLARHPFNAVPMGALALHAGASFPRRWAWLVPVAVMAISDLVLDYGSGRPLLDLSRCLIYSTFAATTLLGPVTRIPKLGTWLLPFLSLAASGVFFLTSNFGAWLVPELNYPRTFGGLMMCYAAGIPFVGRTIVADLIGTGVFFGLGSLLDRSRSTVSTAEVTSTATAPQTQS